MFNPTNIDEFCFQATHIESRGKNDYGNFLNKLVHLVADKNKGKGKAKRTTLVKKENEKPTCLHCKKEGRDDSKCWELHPKLIPKKYWNMKGNKKTTTIVQ